MKEKSKERGDEQVRKRQKEKWRVGKGHKWSGEWERQEEISRKRERSKTNRRREEESRAWPGCKPPPSIFNTVEPLQMMGEREREGGRRKTRKEREGGVLQQCERLPW